MGGRDARDNSVACFFVRISRYHLAHRLPEPIADMPRALSPQQDLVLRFIETYIAQHGWPPTRGEIAVGMGLKNRQGIDQHLKAMAAKQVIELTPKISRGIRVLRPSLPDGDTPRPEPGD